MNVKCQCGAVAFKTSLPTPIGVFHCHCHECRAQSASAFGTTARFPAADIFPLSPELAAALAIYIAPGERADSGRAKECYFCRTCGVRVVHRSLAPDGTPLEVISVKGGLVEGLDWSSAVHIFTESAVVPIPDGVISFARTPPPSPS